MFFRIPQLFQNRAELTFEASCEDAKFELLPSYHFKNFTLK